MEVNKIYLGNTLDVLKTFPDESINCCVTSPPYWALRDYGTDGVIWDGDPECKHEWEEIDVLRKATPGDKPSANSKVAIHRTNNENRPGKPTNFCNKCGAWKGQLGLEPDFNLYIKHLCDIFDEVKRVLRKDGTCWVNLGDTYGGNNSRGSNGGRAGFGNEREGIFSRFESKNLCNIPARFSIEMQNRGWILRNKIIWYKPKCMPSSVTDRFTVDFEEIFFFVKNKKYWFEQQTEEMSEATIKRVFANDNLEKRKDFGKVSQQAISNEKAKEWNEKIRKEIENGGNPKGRNKRTVWKISTTGYSGAHFAVFPEKLVETPIKAGCPKDGIVLDPFMGSGTVALKALKENINFIGIEINPDYIDMAYNRIRPLLSQSKLFEEELICRV